ncbi:MAG: hypothetical protein ACIAS6_13620 [Phycisphaerales bacterium JB060]
MTVLPPTRSELIQFFIQRLPAWEADPASIGLTEEAVASLGQVAASASSLHRDALTARQKSKDATARYHAGADELRVIGAALVAMIKAFAQASGDPGVYALASIPEPADPSPSAAPVAPANIALSMRTSGEVDLSWEGTVAQGTFYEIQRSLDDGPTWATIASVPAREAVDDGVPSGTPRAYYRIRAVKGPAGAGSPDRRPRTSAWSAPQVVFLGRPGQQRGGQAAA